MDWKFVTLALAKKHINVDHSDDDGYIDTLTLIATAVVLNHIKQNEPRTEFQKVPVPDPLTGAYPTPTTWPYSLYPTLTCPYMVTPFWWPIPKLSYQNIPPYVANTWMDTSGEAIPGVIPGEVQGATLLVLGALYKDREGQTDPVTPAVESLLYRWRDPSVA